MTDYAQHPLSAAFPAMTETAFAELRADIAANGLRSPIVLLDDEVLDGWHRYRACGETGTKARFETFAGDDAAARGFVVSVNLMRRHLDTSARAMVAAKFATIGHGGDRKSKDQGANLPLETAAAAEALNVSERTVKDARAVLASGNDDLIAAVQSGEKTVSGAAKEVRASTPKRTPAPKPKPGPAPAPLLPAAPVFEIAPRTIAEWNVLSRAAQQAHLAHRDPRASLNQQKDSEDDNLIDWARWTWNPITGCEHNCPYCYARDIADRFAGTSGFPNGFTPTLMPARLGAPLNARPRDDGDPRSGRIFTGSMADVFGRWVPVEWIEAVFSVVRQAPQWEFLFLTKFPKRMSEFEIPENVWMGTSVDCQARVAAAEAGFEKVKAKVRWLSVEPMLEKLRFRHLDRFDFLVIGGASASSATPRWIPPFSWLDDLMRQADEAGCRVFLKSNLYRKEWPGGPRYVFADRAPDVFHYLGPRALAEVS